MIAIRIRMIALLLALALPGLAPAQGYRGGERAEIKVLNDWQETVKVMIVAERREESIERSWTFEPGESAILSVERDGREFRVRVRGSDRIKIHDDSPGVPIADVARFRDGRWFAKMRDIYRAQRGSDSGRRNFQGDVEPAKVEPGIDRPGLDFSRIVMRSSDPEDCRRACERDSRCKAYTYVNPGVQDRRAICYLKDPVPEAVENSCCTSGVIR